MKKHIIPTLLLLLIIVGCYKESFIPVKAQFTTEVVAGDLSVPVQIKIRNTTEGADTYEWTFEGAEPANSTAKNPGTITYTVPGTYTIQLTARNTDGIEQKMTKEITVYDAIAIEYTQQIVQSNYAPVEVILTNTTPGKGLTFLWTFEGGQPEHFEGKNPPNVIFTTPGKHTITLKVSNPYESFSKITTIEVAPLLVSEFTWTPIFEDLDLEAPVTITTKNQSVSATQYQWTFTGGTPAASTEENPTVTFTHPGTYTLQLVARNDKTSTVSTQQITVLPDTNLKILNDITLGINSAHHNNSYGAFLSTVTETVYTANQISDQNSPLIDIVFNGLNSTFTYNKFTSPAQNSSNGFLPLTGAQNTLFVNSQELCNCGLNFTVPQFESMTNDELLKGLSIASTPAGMQEFGSQLPRIVLFKTQDGRKGAVRIKQFVNNGTQSYIICDIKVQKKNR